jgi:pilus assembly protein CpaF
MAVSELVTREQARVDRHSGHYGFSTELQELKFRLHRKLLDRIKLEALSSVPSDRVRAEIRLAPQPDGKGAPH